MARVVSPADSSASATLETSAHSAFDALVDHIRQLFRVHCVQVFVSDGNTTRCLAWQGWPPHDMLVHPLMNNILSTAEQFAIEDMHVESAFYRLPWVKEDPHFRFFAVQPLFTSDHRYHGAIVLLDKATHRIGARSKRRFTQVGRVLETMLDFHHLSLREEDLSSRMLNDAIAKAQHRFMRSEGDRDTFEGLLGDLLLITRSEFGLIAELRHYMGGKPYLQMHAISNLAWDRETNALYERTLNEGMIFDDLDNLLGHSIKNDHATIVNDLENDPRSHGIPRGHPKIHCYMGLPLFAGNQMVGLIGLANRPGGYASEMEQFFKPLSLTVGTLIERKRLLDEKKQHRNELYHAAHYDSLTQLPNRRRLLQYLEELMSSQRDLLAPFAVCFIDLDGFKAINDALGHDAGDQFLRELAGNLQATIRGEDFLARIGGDEFVMILRGEQNEQSYQRILDAVTRPVTWQGQRLQVTASMGITFYPSDIESADGLLRHADQAMYRAKRQGKNRFACFEPELEKTKQRRFALGESLHRALRHREIALYLQPKVDLQSSEVLAFEVLIRWQHPTDGLIYPNEFLPHLTDTALVAELDRYVLDGAIHMMVEQEERGRLLCLAVNITPAFILSESFDHAIDALNLLEAETRQRLIFEIVESTLLSDMETAISRLERCKAMGVRVSLDDFGTSFSSLTYFRSLPIDEIKIDKSFVLGMLENDEDAKLVASIISIAKSFDRSVIAEGVETQGHVTALKNMGCDKGQGYFYSAPRPAAYYMH